MFYFLFCLPSSSTVLFLSAGKLMRCLVFTPWLSTAHSLKLHKLDFNSSNFLFHSTQHFYCYHQKGRERENITAQKTNANVNWLWICLLKSTRVTSFYVCGYFLQSCRAVQWLVLSPWNKSRFNFLAWQVQTIWSLYVFSAHLWVFCKFPGCVPQTKFMPIQFIH